ncbi:DUF2066 domain-containing protein [Fontimonas sp. SYSU GA230001]|uniref:DUF2066 domain-containing protein n=1 Tax=Fontimonas sp. SYSU GA230001 TaxID=3142450 RepID=UPI0032B437C3
MRVLLTVVALLCSGLCAAQTSTAVQPYEARVPVSDQSPAARDGALREALRTVIRRISGDGAEYTAADLLSRAQQLVQRVGYERETDGSLVLVAGFDGRALESRLRALGLPVWGVHAEQVEDVQLHISGLDSARSYTQVVGAVRGLPGVRAVSPYIAENDHLELRVRVEGGAGRLAGALPATGLLARDNGHGTGLSYRYVRPALP